MNAQHTHCAGDKIWTLAWISLFHSIERVEGVMPKNIELIYSKSVNIEKCSEWGKQ